MSSCASDAHTEQGSFSTPTGLPLTHQPRRAWSAASTPCSAACCRLLAWLCCRLLCCRGLPSIAGMQARLQRRQQVPRVVCDHSVHASVQHSAHL